MLLLLGQICAVPSGGHGLLIQETSPLVLGTTEAQRIISDADSNANWAEAAAAAAEWFRRVVIDDGRRRNEGGKLRLALAFHQLLLVAESRTETKREMVLTMCYKMVFGVREINSFLERHIFRRKTYKKR